MIQVSKSAASQVTAVALIALTVDLQMTELTVTAHWNRARSRLKDPANELAAVFAGKCGYCESRPNTVSFANIDHYRPKTLSPHLTYSWENWIFSCQRCNTYKGSRWDSDLLSPVDDEVELSIGFDGPIIVANDSRGSRTIADIRLDRSELDVARKQHLTMICAIVEAADIVGLSAEDRLVLTVFAVSALRPDAPYAGAARAMFGGLPAGDWPSYDDATSAAFDVLARLQSVNQ